MSVDKLTSNRDLVEYLFKDYGGKLAFEGEERVYNGVLYKKVGSEWVYQKKLSGNELRGVVSDDEIVVGREKSSLSQEDLDVLIKIKKGFIDKVIAHPDLIPSKSLGGGVLYQMVGIEGNERGYNYDSTKIRQLSKILMNYVERVIPSSHSNLVYKQLLSWNKGSHEGLTKDKLDQALSLIESVFKRDLDDVEKEYIYNKFNITSK